MDSHKLTHFDENGQAIMVDVSNKKATERMAVASGKIIVNKAVYEAVENGTVAKGDVLGVARIAGIMAAKRTDEMIPLCHSLPISSCRVDFRMLKRSWVKIKYACNILQKCYNDYTSKIKGEYMAEKGRGKKQSTKRRTRRLSRGMIFLIVIAVIIGIFVYIPFFTLREVKLIGAAYLTSNDIIKISNIYIGEPLFQLETDEVTKRLQQDLRIEDVRVKRELPFTLEVEIKERRPLATIVCDYGYLDLDRNGKVLDSYKTLKEMPIPMITGALAKDLYIGDDVDDKIVQKILFFLQQLSETSLNRLSEVAVIDADYIVAYTNTAQAVQIRIGKLERLEEKARLTEDFLQDLELNPHKVEYVDFNYTAPFIKLAQ